MKNNYLHVYIATLIFSACSILYSLSVSYFISLLYGNTITVYSLTVGSYMFFLGMGAFFYDRIKDKYGVKILLLTETFLVLTAFLGPLFISYFSTLEVNYNLKLFISFFVLGLIGILSGIELPLLMNFAKDKISIIIGIDYFGGLTGSLLYVFVILPNFNTVSVFHYIAFFNLITAIFFYYFYSKINNSKIDYKIIFSMIVLFILLLSISRFIVKKTEYYFLNKRLQLKVYTDFNKKMTKKPDVKINQKINTPYQEIIDANFTLYGKDSGDVNFTHKMRCVLINRMYQFCSDWAYEYHFFSYIVPSLFFNPDKKLNVLVIGGGDLIGTSALLKYVNIKNIDIIDIDKQMVRFAENKLKYFQFLKNRFYDDKRVHIHIGDAFVYINKIIKSGKKYDIIVYDLPVIDNYKLLPLLSIEFLKKIRKAIKDDGIFSIYQEIGGFGIEPIKKESYLIGCAGFHKVLFEKGFKIKPSNHILYEDNFLYFTVNNKLHIKNKKLLKKMLLNDIYLINKFYQQGVEYDLKCSDKTGLNSIFKPDFSILEINRKKY